MNEGAILALALVVFAWAILSEPLSALDLSAPLVLLVAGFLLGNSSWGIVSVNLESSTVHALAEITLAMLLFADASTVPVAAARRDAGLIARLLGIGLPFSIVAGSAVAILLFPSIPLALAVLLGASLAPTDAALSASVVADERLPARVRRVLNVESGLNDGIATPVVTVSIAASATALGIVGHDESGGLGAVGEIAIGVGVGVGAGLVGGLLIHIAYQRRWTHAGSTKFATLALALIAFFIATETGGNAFVAAFIGGFVFGATAPDDASEGAELTELLGSLLSLALWFIFGAGLILPLFQHLDGRTVLYAVISLTLVRMVPVAISLVGAGQDRATVAFVSWFGPRGLASVVFALLAVEELGSADPQVRSVVNAIAATIMLSIIAHGITARPLTLRYLAARSADRPDADDGW
jgi:NhaP-type Na+/H+ or K+/H+ antiporter